MTFTEDEKAKMGFLMGTEMAAIAIIVDRMLEQITELDPSRKKHYLDACMALKKELARIKTPK
jgi:hypothetical protein